MALCLVGWFNLGDLEAQTTQNDIKKGQVVITRPFWSFFKLVNDSQVTSYIIYIYITRIFAYIHLQRKEIIKHILRLRPGRDVLEFFFFAKSKIDDIRYKHISLAISISQPPGMLGQPPWVPVMFNLLAPNQPGEGAK